MAEKQTFKTALEQIVGTNTDGGGYDIVRITTMIRYTGDVIKVDYYPEFDLNSFALMLEDGGMDLREVHESTLVLITNYKGEDKESQYEMSFEFVSFSVDAPLCGISLCLEDDRVNVGELLNEWREKYAPRHSIGVGELVDTIQRSFHDYTMSDLLDFINAFEQDEDAILALAERTSHNVKPSERYEWLRHNDAVFERYCALHEIDWETTVLSEVIALSRVSQIAKQLKEEIFPSLSAFISEYV